MKFLRKLKKCNNILTKLGNEVLKGKHKKVY